MDRLRFVRRALGAAAAASMLVACAASQLSGATPASLPTVAGTSVLSASMRSWISSGAQNGDLLYVSDANGAVYVYSYPAAKLVGTLTGFKGPAGLCSDRAGNVYVVDTPAVAVLKYAHGGKKPIEVLHVYGYYPQGCSVDATTGDLAVANYASNPQLGPGSVTIFRKGRGMGTSYQASNFNEYFFCGFDAKGNLFVDGTNAGTTQTELAELPHGGASLTGITLKQNLGPFPGAVQWDGKYVALEDATTNALYRIKVTGSNGTVAGTLRFKGDRSSLLAQFWIAGSTIVVPYGVVKRTVRKIGFWPYPAGGAAAKSIQAPTGASELFGSTVSVGKN
jgi:hypothetical protein